MGDESWPGKETPVSKNCATHQLEAICSYMGKKGEKNHHSETDCGLPKSFRKENQQMPVASYWLECMFSFSQKR